MSDYFAVLVVGWVLGLLSVDWLEERGIRDDPVRRRLEQLLREQERERLGLPREERS